MPTAAMMSSVNTRARHGGFTSHTIAAAITRACQTCKVAHSSLGGRKCQR
jgi:hypothetical protein